MFGLPHRKYPSTLQATKSVRCSAFLKNIFLQRKMSLHLSLLSQSFNKQHIISSRIPASRRAVQCCEAFKTEVSLSCVLPLYSIFKVLSADPLHLHGLGRAEKQGSFESFLKKALFYRSGPVNTSLLTGTLRDQKLPLFSKKLLSLTPTEIVKMFG